jgi:UDP-N-acetylmuramoyl-L-alanyl-D-glutamate--2,6-diaminopimelate ligase
LNLYNILAAATTALALGIDKESIIAGLQAVSLVDGRLQRVLTPPWAGFEVVVDYAHTPDAMEKSLTCLREMTKRRLLTVFGCGGDRDRGKRPQMGNVAARLSDVVIVTSDNPRGEFPDKIIQDIEPGISSLTVPYVEPNPVACPEQKAYTREIDRKKAIELALCWARNGDTVFIGGKGHETYQIIGENVLPFDDREVVRAYFRKLETRAQALEQHK